MHVSVGVRCKRPRRQLSFAACMALGGNTELAAHARQKRSAKQALYGVKVEGHTRSGRELEGWWPGGATNCACARVCVRNICGECHSPANARLSTLIPSHDATITPTSSSTTGPPREHMVIERAEWISAKRNVDCFSPQIGHRQCNRTKPRRGVWRVMCGECCLWRPRYAKRTEKNFELHLIGPIPHSYPSQLEGID